MPPTGQCTRASGRGGGRVASPRGLASPARDDGQLRNDIRRQQILDLPDFVAEHQFALFQALHLNEVGTWRGGQRSDSGVEVAMFLLQARQLLPQRAFFLVGHCHR
jgi:hypothetical protein